MGSSSFQLLISSRRSMMGESVLMGELHKVHDPSFFFHLLMAVVHKMCPQFVTTGSLGVS